MRTATITGWPWLAISLALAIVPAIAALSFIGRKAAPVAMATPSILSLPIWVQGLRPYGIDWACADLGELTVIEHVIDHAKRIARGGEDLHAGHHEGAVADDRLHGTAGKGEFRADRRRHRIAHAVEIGGQDHALRRVGPASARR